MGSTREEMTNFISDLLASTHGRASFGRPQGFTYIRSVRALDEVLRTIQERWMIVMTGLREFYYFCTIYN